MFANDQNVLSAMADYTRAIERGSAILRRLDEALAASQAAAVAMDYDGIVRGNELQEAICREWMDCDAEMRAISEELSAAPCEAIANRDSESDARLIRAIGELNRRRQKVRRANEVQRTVVVRTRRTLSMLDNLYTFYSDAPYGGDRAAAPSTSPSSYRS